MQSLPEHRSRSRRHQPGNFCLLSIALAAAALAGCAQRPEWSGQAVDPPREAPELAGLNWDGRPFRLSEQRGRVAVVSFGYTFCPDICPMTLWKMKELYGRLGEASSDLAFVFVTVDPKRDTPEKIAEYVSAFDPRFYGVFVEGEDLEATTAAWEITVRQVPFQNPANLDGSYTVDHTGTYFVVDRHGRLRVRHTPKASVEEMLPDLRILLEES